MKKLIAMCSLMVLASLSLIAESRFDGTWEMKMDSLQFSVPPEEYALTNGRYHCLTCVPKLDVKADGSEQKVTGHSNYDTIAVKVLDSNSVKFVFKKGGRPTFACLETVSQDGNTMMEEFTETPLTEKVTGHAMFTRVGSARASLHPLSGLWQMRTVKNVSAVGPTTTYLVTKVGLKCSEGTRNFEAKFDGREYPVRGVPNQTVSLKRADGRTIEETYREGGTVISIKHSTLSDDGKSMTVKSTEAQRGGTMTYIAEKRLGTAK